MRLALASVLLLALVAAAAAADRRSLLADALSPTQKLNQQKQQQMKAESQKKAQEAQARRVQTQRLNAPCFVPSSYYPIAACRWGPACRVEPGSERQPGAAPAWLELNSRLPPAVSALQPEQVPPGVRPRVERVGLVRRLLPAGARRLGHWIDVG